MWQLLEGQAGSQSEPGPGTGPSALGWPVSSAGCSPAPAESFAQSAPLSAPLGLPPPLEQHTSGDSSPGPEADRDMGLSLDQQTWIKEESGTKPKLLYFCFCLRCCMMPEIRL